MEVVSENREAEDRDTFEAGTVHGNDTFFLPFPDFGVVLGASGTLKLGSFANPALKLV